MSVKMSRPPRQIRAKSLNLKNKKTEDEKRLFESDGEKEFQFFRFKFQKTRGLSLTLQSLSIGLFQQRATMTNNPDPESSDVLVGGEFLFLSEVKIRREVRTYCSGDES